MEELREEVLRAEEMIRELADELKRAKETVDSVAIIERKLGEAADIMKQSQEAIKSTHGEITSAISTLEHISEKIDQTYKTLPYSVDKAIKNSMQKIDQSLTQTHQSLSEISRTIYLVQQLALDIKNVVEQINVDKAIKNSMQGIDQSLTQTHQSLNEISRAIHLVQQLALDIKNIVEQINQRTIQTHQDLHWQLTQQNSKIIQISNWLKLYAILFISSVLGTMAIFTVILKLR